MALFSITLISVFLATIRGGTKSQLVQNIHQEGDFALKKMADTIRSAVSVDCGGNEISVNTISGSTVVFSLSGTRVASDSSKFLTGTLAEAKNLSFTCYDGVLGNQVVTLALDLETANQAAAQAQEKVSENFATSVSTRQY